MNDTWDWNRGRLILYYSSNHAWGCSGTDNNGNLIYAENWVPPPNATPDQAQTLTQDSYSYDALNRLSAVNESSLDIAGGGSWISQFAQVYNYDRYGNRTIDQANTWGTGIPKPNFGVDTSTNRLTPPAGTMSYDAAGNLTTDSFTGEGTRTYDAENRMKQAWANNQWQTYTYDGDGHRVRRTVNGTEIWQVYGIGGELLAEYAANAGPSTPQKEYGYRNGQLLVAAEASANVHWLVTDQLGTPRMIADLSGSLSGISRHDYLPFGEELYAGTGARTTAQGYTLSDNVRQKFTKYERDNETGLDFAQARYYGSGQGRFTSPDPLMGSGRTASPQSWNRYVYCGNSPLVLVDPTGLDWGYYNLGNGEVSVVWFQGEVGRYKGRPYKPIDFGKSSSKVLTLVGGSRVEIFKNGGSNPLTQMASRPSQSQNSNQTQDEALPEANQAVIRQVAAQPYEKATAVFALASVMQGYGVAGSTILFADSVAAAALIVHDQTHQDEESDAGMAGTTRRAREVSGGELTEAQVPDAALMYLGPGYKEIEPGRYVSADGLHQIRFGAHETRGQLHIHFEVYDTSYFEGGRVFENSVVKIIP